MKRIISVFVCLAILFSFAIPASAANFQIAVNVSTTTAKVGDTVVYTILLSGAPNATSGSIAITVDHNLEVVSGNFLKTGSIMAKFDMVTKKGAIAFSNATDLNGNYFKLTVKGKAALATAQNVTVSIELKNGSNAIGTANGSKGVKIICANHSFGSVTKLNDSQHKRDCSVCGYEEKSNHAWNSGTITKAANCKENGAKKHTCIVCGAEKTTVISKTNNHNWGGWKITKQPTCTVAGTTTKTCSVCKKTENQKVNATGHNMGNWAESKSATCTTGGEEKRSCSKCGYIERRSTKALGHSFSSPTVTKQPTCTEGGIESGKCNRCGQTTTNSVKAKGHQFGAWTVKTAATCTAAGVEEHKCTVCNATETRSIPELGHDFENPIVVKAATLTEAGLKEGKCKRCGNTTSEVIPCWATDESTGISIKTTQGTFESGTEFKTEEIKPDNPTYGSAQNILKDICKQFKMYNIAALLNGAAVEPNGKVMTTFAVPKGYGKNVALYLVKPDGTSEKIEAEVSEDGNNISAILKSFGDYAICRLDSGSGNSNDASTETVETTNEQNGINTVAVAIIAVVIVALAVLTVIIVKRKKQNNI